jgi:hypothetical protein
MALLFISYASEDDRRPDDDPGARGWVSALDHSLKLELSADLKLWRDKRDLGLPGVIRDNLAEQIKNADFLLPVLSEYHSKSSNSSRSSRRKRTRPNSSSG